MSFLDYFRSCLLLCPENRLKMTSFNYTCTVVENVDAAKLQKKTNNAAADGGERGQMELWTIN